MGYYATMQPQDTISTLISIATEAGVIAQKYFRRSSTSVNWKEDNTPVTQADQEMDALIHSRLGAIEPGLPIVSEEMRNATFCQRQHWRRMWIVDPLDGTSHYIAGREDYSVNIALVEDGKPMLSVVYAPATAACYYAIRHQGAFAHEAQTDRQLLCRNEQQGPIRVAISHGTPGWRLRSFLQQCGDYQLVKLGSSLKQCWIAEDRVDVYPRFGKTSEWDTAAAQLILEEAGGLITNQAGNILVYNKENLLNPEFIARVPWFVPTTPWYSE